MGWERMLRKGPERYLYLSALYIIYSITSYRIRAYRVACLTNFSVYFVKSVIAKPLHTHYKRTYSILYGKAIRKVLKGKPLAISGRLSSWSYLS